MKKIEMVYIVPFLKGVLRCLKLFVEMAEE